MRRTVVTGVGVVAPGGVTRDEFWDRITSGKPATRKISFFDPSGFRSQIAAEADFDPIAAGLEQHEIERMDRYIQFAAASAMQAVDDSAIDLEEVDSERMAVTLGSAVGGTMVLEDGYVAVSNRGKEWLVDPDYAPPFLYAGLVPSSLASEIALKFGAQGPAVVISTGCTSGIDAHRLRPPADPGRRGRRGDLGRVGIADLADLDGLLRPDQGDLVAQRGPRARLAALRRRPRRLRDGRGRRGAPARGVRDRHGAWRAHLLRGHRLRQPRQRLPHDRAASRGVRDGRGDQGRPAAGRHQPRGDRLHQRARVRHQAERPPRDPGLQEHARASTPTRSRSARSSR